jgi:hypothetical protein
MFNLTYKLGQGCIDLEEGVIIIVFVNPFVCEELYSWALYLWSDQISYVLLALGGKGQNIKSDSSWI